MSYFTTLLRYIHQNPVKAGIVEHVRDIEMVGVTNSSAFQVLEDKSKRMVLKELKDKGASYRQLERLTGVGRGLIQKL